MIKLISFLLALIGLTAMAQFPGAANTAGTTAIYKDSSAIVNWATQVIYFNPGKEDTAVVASIDASYGTSSAALFEAEGTSTEVVSLGDGGEIILGFEFPIMNGTGNDFAVFENSFSHAYLEFAHVEVSTDGINFVRFPSISNTDVSVQTGTYENSDPTLVHNLAGKYIQGYGTPFDLEDLKDSTGINLDSINFVKIVDVVGTINATYGSFDSEGNIINDPYPSEFESGGFDLDAVSVMFENRADAGFKENAFDFVVYPNPTKGGVTINVKDIKTGKIFDFQGKLVHSFDESGTVDFRELGLNAGIYIIQIQTNKGLVGQERIAYQY